MRSALTILIAVGIYGVLHSLLASLGAKAWARQQLGERWARYYRLAFNALGVLTLLPVLALVPLLPDATLYLIPRPWTFVALFVQLMGVVILALGVLQTGWLPFSGLDALRGKPSRSSGPPRLVTSGLYSQMRHPIYTGGFLLMLGTPLMTQNLLALYAGFAAYLILGAQVEERKLLKEFGEAYALYQKRVGMFLPKIGRSRSP